MVKHISQTDSITIYDLFASSFNHYDSSLTSVFLDSISYIHLISMVESIFSLEDNICDISLPFSVVVHEKVSSGNEASLLEFYIFLLLYGAQNGKDYLSIFKSSLIYLLQQEFQKKTYVDSVMKELLILFVLVVFLNPIVSEITDSLLSSDVQYLISELFPPFFNETKFSIHPKLKINSEGEWIDRGIALIVLNLLPFVNTLDIEFDEGVRIHVLEIYAYIMYCLHRQNQTHFHSYIPDIVSCLKDVPSEIAYSVSSILLRSYELSPFIEPNYSNLLFPFISVFNDSCDSYALQLFLFEDRMHKVGEIIIKEIAQKAKLISQEIIGGLLRYLCIDPRGCIQDQKGSFIDKFHDAFKERDICNHLKEVGCLLAENDHTDSIDHVITSIVDNIIETNLVSK